MVLFLQAETGGLTTDNKKRGAPTPSERLSCLGVEENLRLWLSLRLRLRFGVVLFMVDIFRRGVLFVVDLFLFGGRQRSAVGLAVCGNLLVDALLLILEFGCFARGELPALDALSNAVLLVFAALVHFVVSIVLRLGVVLVGVNLLGHLILLSVDLLLFRRGQLAAVGRAVRLGFAVDGRFFRFQVSGFTGCQLAALHALRDAVLLIFSALRDRRLGFLCWSCRRCRAATLRWRWCCRRRWRRLRGRSWLVLRHRYAAGEQHRGRQGAPLHPGEFHFFSPNL